MPHLMLDPNLEVRPDFTSAAYDALCTALAAAEGVDKGAIVAHLSDAWNIENDAKKATWDEQVRQDKAEEAEAELAREREQQLKLEERRKVEETERKEKEKKKPKLKNFVPNKLVGNTVQLRPSHYAIHKLEEREYVELYYFTQDGCMEALKIDHTITQDAFTFTKADDTLLLKPMASHKPSNKAIPDKHLTWRQMSLAKTTLLHHMSQAGWPEHLIIALAEFYLNLKGHPTRHEVDGDTVLLHYQAQVRREWHEALRGADDNNVFDISTINDRHVDAIGSQIWNARRNEGVLRLVHPSVLEQPTRTNVRVSPLSPLDIYPPQPYTHLPSYAPCTLHLLPVLCAPCLCSLCTMHPCITCTHALRASSCATCTMHSHGALTIHCCVNMCPCPSLYIHTCP
ncbi:uncharacterized protein LACBIDRAFT_299589 [Laccaria bicolor S238N-H82]|uniref:Predicted protein n=1 Tax=Laccaria bicolor (strain S238N-H82 / ATCC MYA-4686) TaxID=486041 RepID=B0DEX5_LACBS|nr:uncharacterized protein LACBIDRAFT_299589 [Laccaria bicolor S238N-H82]EDR06748.1 predicted protein [Laccaria bicolor S238N-H82]|eukprot:XP_001882595.1 predicted protein [Laccaria bicolor S238N-H82]